MKICAGCAFKDDDDGNNNNININYGSTYSCMLPAPVTLPPLTGILTLSF